MGKYTISSLRPAAVGRPEGGGAASRGDGGNRNRALVYPFVRCVCLYVRVCVRVCAYFFVCVCVDLGSWVGEWMRGLVSYGEAPSI